MLYELHRYIFEPDGLILQNYPVCTSNPIKVLIYNVYRRILSLGIDLIMINILIIVENSQKVMQWAKRTRYY